MSKQLRSQPPRPAAPEGRRDRGSALVLAIFVLVLLAGMGIVLMSIGQNEVKMGKASLQTTQAFFLAEAGLENGRATLMDVNGTTDLTAELKTAAGGNDTFDFNPEKLRIVYNDKGEVSGFTGYGDDVPLRTPTKLGDGIYAAFLTNDPEELLNADTDDDLNDANERVLIYGVGTGPGDSLEIVQAIVEPDPLLPTLPPCMVMMLGPDPEWDGGDGRCTMTDEGPDETADERYDEDEDFDNVANKTYYGTDCAGSGGRSGFYVPTICVEGCQSRSPGPDEDEDEYDDEDEAGDVGDDGWCNDMIVELSVEAAAIRHPGLAEDWCPNDYVSGPYTGDNTVADIYDAANEPTMGPDYTIDPEWLDCQNLADIAEQAREMADFKCSAGGCDIGNSSRWDDNLKPTTTSSTIVFVDGDLKVGASYRGSGMLFVTGVLYMDGTASWSGPIVLIGKGEFRRTGGTGAGVMSGATVLANIAGLDGVYGTSDDCQTGSRGFHVAIFEEAEFQTGPTMYCTDDLTPANPLRTYDVTLFRQH